MIITVTMNPAIDKTVYLKELKSGELNRIDNITEDVGGKGVNVSKMLAELGMQHAAAGISGGSSGRKIQEELIRMGIHSDFIAVSGETRTNTKVVEADGRVTELNEPGPCVTDADCNLLLKRLLEYADENAIFVLSGSVPKGVSKDIYRKLILELKKKRAKVFLDADGELFSQGLQAGPDFIKPNKYELEKYMSKRDFSEEELLQAGKELLRQGIQTVLISLGEEGAYFLTREKGLYCKGISVPVRSTVGAGDTMVAAFTYGIASGMTLEECARISIAASAGAVTTVGTKAPEKMLVESLLKQVEITTLW